MTSRRATGIAVVAAYAALAFVSGRLSPLARGPLLDGFGGNVLYRWVNPPPAFKSTNQPPAAGSFTIRFGPNGSAPNVFVTSDNQVTIIVPRGAFAGHGADTGIKLAVDPVDPATLSPVAEGVVEFGNAYRLTATYVPSGATAKLATPLDMILVYPVTPNVHAAKHQIYASTDGSSWSPQAGSDSIAQQQAEGPLPALGYAIVAGHGGPVPSPVPGPGSGSGSSSGNVRIALIVIALGVGLLGVGLILRSRGSPG